MIRYEFFTGNFRGYDLVWDFLVEQSGTFTDGILTVKATYGYERARSMNVFADDQQISHSTDLWDRFTALEPVFRSFWRTLETAATEWQKEQEAAVASRSKETKRLDDELCAQILERAKCI